MYLEDGAEGDRVDPRWEQIYAECRPPLYRVAAFLVGNAEGEEIVQDAFERAIRQRRFFDEVGQPLAWLRRVVVRLAVSRLRRRAVWERIFPLLEQHEATEASIDPDLEAAIRKLPPRQRGAIVLRYYFDADYAEIASTLGLSEASIGKTLSRARAVLKEDLA
jgi:RNA polymerase sigma factor (sigma-70 family)